VGEAGRWVARDEAAASGENERLVEERAIRVSLRVNYTGRDVTMNE
jgi:hypothetical protein